MKQQEAIMYSTINNWKLSSQRFQLLYKKVIQFKRFLDHLRVLDGVIELVTIYYDNQKIIAYTKNLKYQVSTKQIDIKYKYIEDIISHKEINMKYISIREMTIYSLTKLIMKDIFLGV